jgi:undecaprenyl-diphosphatase
MGQDLVPGDSADATSPSVGEAVPTTTALVVTGVVGGVVFAALMAGAAWVYDAVTEADGVAGLDRPVLDWAIGLRTPTSEAWVTAFTNLGRTLPMVVIGVSLMVSLYLTYRRRTVLVLSLVAAAGGVSFTIVAKALVGRSRPPLVDAVPPYEDSFSFPSGHTLNSTVVAGILAYLVLWLVTRTWLRVAATLGAVLWAAAMGLSRVFLGHHWLTDVIFAWLFGLAWLALLITVHRVLLHRRSRRALRAE